jgi:two-component system response regulator
MAKLANADVLLIDDSLEDAELTIYALRGTCTHVTVETFARTDDALSYLTCTGPYSERHAHTPQLIVMNLDLPNADAAQALRRFKTHEELRAIPLIVLTTRREPSLIKECYELGANSVLCKASQLKDYFEQMQQLAKYWLQVNEAVETELDSDEDLPGGLSSRAMRFDELRHN